MTKGTIEEYEELLDELDNEELLMWYDRRVGVQKMYDQLIEDFNDQLEEAKLEFIDEVGSIIDKRKSGKKCKKKVNRKI